MYRFWLANLKGIGNQKKLNLIEHFGDSKAVYFSKSYDMVYGMTKKDIMVIEESKNTNDLDKQWSFFQEKGIGFVTVEDNDYPLKLKNINNPPFALYFIGRLPKSNIKNVAIVGARGRSAYGSQVAEALATKLAGANVNVISGMARGIDADGHRGVLQVNGSTYAVLGCGVDVCYPKENHYIYEEIPKNGGIISEYCPGTPPKAAFFPARNRIISGLADAVIVVEAKEKSGSLITADFALEQGREVYALPGRIYDPLSGGCNRLIQQGAYCITDIDEVVSEITLSSSKNDYQIDFRKNLLEKDELLVYSLLDFRPLGLGELLDRTPISLSKMIEILERLVEQGFAKETVPNYFVKSI